MILKWKLKGFMSQNEVYVLLLLHLSWCTVLVNYPIISSNLGCGLFHYCSSELSCTRTINWLSTHIVGHNNSFPSQQIMEKKKSFRRWCICGRIFVTAGAREADWRLRESWMLCSKCDYPEVRLHIPGEAWFQLSSCFTGLSFAIFIFGLKENGLFYKLHCSGSHYLLLNPFTLV